PLLGDVKRQTVVNGVEKTVRDLSAFKWGFLAAGIAMLLGTISFFILKNKYVVTPHGAAIGGKPRGRNKADSDDVQAKFTSKSVGILIGMLIFFYFLFQYLSWSPATMPMTG